VSFGKYFEPLLNIKIAVHISQISFKIGTLKPGVNLIILGEWFMVEQTIGFKGNGIQVKRHICDPEPIISPMKDYYMIKKLYRYDG
jgi:hypothetical protein